VPSGVEVDELDLADLGSVRRLAERLLSFSRQIDIVIDNGGVMACPETRVGPGWEAQFATNHLGRYALVNLLRPAIARSGDARVVSVASGLGDGFRIRWDDVHFEHGYDKWQAYAQSKAANVMFAAQLDRLGQAFGVRAFSVNPGYIITPLQRHLTKEEMVTAGWIDNAGIPVHPAFTTPEHGAATQVWAATSPQLAGMGGVYCQDCDIAEDNEHVSRATDPSEGARLWALSANLTGVDAFAPANDQS
jgi:NAD(P)-dependent dehydrogenase (short-subunit alcohol dehydrogenase family)